MTAVEQSIGLLPVAILLALMLIGWALIKYGERRGRRNAPSILPVPPRTPKGFGDSYIMPMPQVRTIDVRERTFYDFEEVVG